MQTVVEDNHSPYANKYKNTIVRDEANKCTYIYDCAGVWTAFPQKVNCAETLNTAAFAAC